MNSLHRKKALDLNSAQKGEPEASNDLKGGLNDKPSKKPNAQSTTVTSLQPIKQTNNSIN